MAKPIRIVENSTNTSLFARLPYRAYIAEAPPLKRVFETSEQWYIVSGSLTFRDDFTNLQKTAQTGNIISLPKNSGFSMMKFAGNCKIKQYIDDATVREKISTNIRINYLIIQAVLELVNSFDTFTSVPFGIEDSLFVNARSGDLYGFHKGENGAFFGTEQWELVDAIILNYAERTGISEDVWYGRRRLNTGLKYAKRGWKDENSIDQSIFNLDLKSAEVDGLYDALLSDPLDIERQYEIDFNEHMHSLKSLFILIARNIKQEEQEIFKNYFPSDIELRQPQGTSELMNKNGMPPHIRYGQELQEVMRRLFWCSSIGFQNKDRLKKMI